MNIQLFVFLIQMQSLGSKKNGELSFLFDDKSPMQKFLDILLDSRVSNLITKVIASNIDLVPYCI